MAGKSVLAFKKLRDNRHYERLAAATRDIGNLDMLSLESVSHCLFKLSRSHHPGIFVMTNIRTGAPRNLASIMKPAQAVRKAIEKLYPKEYADSSWDNTGLLVDCSELAEQRAPSVLLTVDLTSSVAHEAIANGNNVIVAYHPFIFRGLKSITPQDPQQRSLLKLVSNHISVYSPHTAVDAARGGVNDWLAMGITDNGANIGESKPISVKGSEPEGVGMGRKVLLKEPLTLSDLVGKVKALLDLDTIQVVRPDTDVLIESIALCAGSGGSVFQGVDADVYFTGELGHHEMLHIRESGKCALVCGHSNTERGYLAVMKELLEKELGPEAEITIAKTDVDPICYV